MGKISKSAKVSKALVKRGIAKSIPRSDIKSENVDMEKEAVVKPSAGQPTLKEISKMIASAPISRGKRKRAIKKARLEGRKAFAAFAVASKKTADDVRGFGEALGSFKEMFEAIEPTSDASNETTEEKPKATITKKLGGALKRNKKAQADLVDMQRVQALFQIPEFSSDPLSAIEKHLQNLKAKKERAHQSTTGNMEVS